MRASLVDEIETSGEVESARFDSHVRLADGFGGEGKDDSFLRCKKNRSKWLGENKGFMYPMGVFTYAICYWVLTELMW